MQSSTGRNVLAAVAARLGAPGGADLRAEGVGDAPSRAEPTPLGAQAGAHRFSICYFTNFRNFPSLVLNRQAKKKNLKGLPWGKRALVASLPGAHGEFQR